MIPMANKPMMEHTVALLRHHGFEDLATPLYFQPEVIERYFGDGSEFGVKMACVTETEDCGTAGAAKNAESYLVDTFLIIGRNALTDFDFSAALKLHKLIPDQDRPSFHIIAEANTLSRAEAHVARYRQILEHRMKEAVVEAVG
jgi:NDP-sugar pyrophosphorylase family protein